MTADPHAPKRRAAAVFVFVTVLIDVLSFGIIIPVLPQLMEQLAHGGIAEAAVWVGVLSAMFAVIQFLSSPVQGALSDRYGRRPVILLSNLGLGIDFLVMALAPTLWLLFVGRAISAVASASFTTANAYVADVTPRERRAAAFGMIGAAFGVGFVVGPALGGLLGGLDLRLPFLGCGRAVAGQLLLRTVRAAGVAGAGATQSPARLAPRQSARRAAPAGAPPRGARAGGGAAPVPARPLRAAEHLRALHRLSLRLGSERGRLHPRRGWRQQRTGPGRAHPPPGAGAGRTPRAVRRTGLRHRRAHRHGLGAGRPGVSRHHPADGAVGPRRAAGAGADVGRVGPEEQGRLQGAVSSLNSLAGIFGPLLFTNVFALSIAQTPARVPGLAFYLAAAILLIGAVIAWRAAKGRKSEDASGQYT
jgi:Arabinose efflux permease